LPPATSSAVFSQEFTDYRLFAREKPFKKTGSCLDTDAAHAAQIGGSNRCDFGAFSDCILTEKQRFSSQFAPRVGLFAPF
jgi:hypothetical protein